MSLPLKIDLSINCNKKIAPAVDSLHAALEVAWVVGKSRHCETVNEVAVKIIETEEMCELNKVFRGKNAPTNVLAFPSLPIPGMHNTLLGDIAICAPVVWSEANEQNIPIVAHWSHMAIHSLLHLLGYDHQTDEEADIMQSLEVKALKKLGFPNPYLLFSFD